MIMRIFSLSCNAAVGLTFIHVSKVIRLTFIFISAFNLKIIVTSAGKMAKN